MMPRETVSRYFPFILLIRLFLLSADLKIVQNKNKSSRSAELANFFNMKNSTLQTFKIITLKSLLMNVSFLLEVISRSQLPKNSKILYRCFGRRLLQDRHESDWNITLRVVLVSPYSVAKLPSPNCMKHYLFVVRKSQACSKSLEKTLNSFEPL